MPDNQIKGDFSSVLQSLMSNPQLLGNIASMISSNVGTNQGTGAHAPSPPPAREESVRDERVREDEEMSAVSAPVSASPFPFLQNKTHNESKEKALLCALKPFLPSKKCQTIDSFIRILDIVSLVGRIK